jgi:transcriptional regulator with XRE-family HTH domain
MEIDVMDLTKIVSNNLKQACVELDLSTRELAARSGSNQKSVWNLLNGEHSPRLSTIQPVCQILSVSPAAAVTPDIDPQLLSSRRVPRLIENYSRLSPSQRDLVEAIMPDMLAA